ncbi:MAG: transporter substrate-binding domain-containing protein, partial [Candidatus Woesearchaeota archaeon]
MKKKLNKNNDIKNKKKNLRLYLKLSFFFLIYLFFFLFFISFVISQEKINELNVEYLAKKVALDIDNYNISEKTMAELESDFVFRNLALQTDNLGMYTTIVDADNGFIYFHPQKTLEKKYSYLLKEKYFQAWLIINKTLKTCSDSYGYYDWLEEDGKLTKKYMYLTCTETKTKDNKRLIVASTGYLNSSVGIDYIFNYFHKNLVLVAQEYPPYISNLLLEKGFFTELTKEAFKRQNYNIDVKIMSWTEAYNGAKEGLYDGIIHVWYTKERENYFAYSDEMPPTEFVFCTLQKSNISDFKDLNSLKNFKIGSVKDYGYPEEFKKANLTKIESIFDYENIENLINGNVDLIIIDKAQFEYYKNNFYSNSSIFCLSPSFKTVPAHVIISKKLPNYLKIIYDFNEGLKKIKYDGTYDKILKKHNMTFYIKFDKKLKSASEKDYPPLAIVINDSGHLISDGFSVELLKEVLKSQGYEVDFYIDDWNNIKNDLKNQKIDLLPLVARTPEREAYFDFSVPYITLKGAVFTRDNSNIKSYENLKNKKIIVMKGDNAEEYVLRNKITDKLITTKTYEEAFLLLSKENSYDAIIVQEIVGNSIIKKLNLKNIKKAFVLEDFKQDFAFAVSKGNKDLLNILNEGLSKKIADGTYENLYKKWLIFEKKENEIYFDKTFFIKLFFIIFIILIITIIAYFISPKSFMPILFLLIAFLIIILLINTFNQTKRIEKIAIDLSKNELESLSRITEHHIEHVIEDYKRMIKSLTTQENLTKEELEKIKEADNYIEKLFVSDEDYKKENQSIIINNTKYIVIYSPYKERYLVAFVNIDLFKNIKPFFSIYKTSEILINEELNDFDYKNIKNDYKLKNSFEDEDYIYYYNYIREIDFSYLIKIEKKEILFNIKATNNLLWINTLLLIISIIFLSFIGNYFITRELKKEIKNKTKDLENLNKELENKVSERTKELEYLNLNLERKVSKRTNELEEKIKEL